MVAHSAVCVAFHVVGAGVGAAVSRLQLGLEGRPVHVQFESFAVIVVGVSELGPRAPKLVCAVGGVGLVPHALQLAVINVTHLAWLAAVEQIPARVPEESEGLRTLH